MPAIKSDLACPTCEREGKESRLMSGGGTGKVGLWCDEGHEFVDTGELMAMNPRRLSLPKQAPKPAAAGLVELRIPIQGAISKALRARFPDNMDQSITGVLQAICNPRTVVIWGDDMNALSQLLLREIKSSQELIGAVFNLKREKDQAEQDSKVAKSKSSGPATENGKGLRLDVDDEMLAAITGKAEFNGQSSEEYIKSVIVTGFQNGWF